MGQNDLILRLMYLDKDLRCWKNYGGTFYPFTGLIIQKDVGGYVILEMMIFLGC